MEEEKKAKVKRKIKYFVIDLLKFCGILLVCAIVGIWLAIGTRAGSSLRFAQRYFKYFASNNYSEMYKMVDCKEDDFINEDSFTYKYESNKIYGGIKKYKFQKPVEKDGKIIYTVKFTTGRKKKGSIKIALKKQNKKVYGMFNTWKVNVDDEIASDSSLAITSTVGGYIDHISLDSCKKTSSKDGSMNFYFIDRMFKGDHTVTLNHENLTSYTFTESFDKSGVQAVIDASKLELPETDKKEMYDYSKFVLGSMYGYAMDGKTQFDDFAYMFNNDDNTKQLAKACFDNLRAATVKDDGGLLQQLNINNVSVALASYTYPDDALVDVAYTYSYVARTGRTSISGITSDYDGMGTAMAMIRYKRIDGTWKVIDISMPCADYSKKE